MASCSRFREPPTAAPSRGRTRAAIAASGQLCGVSLCPKSRTENQPRTDTWREGEDVRDPSGGFWGTFGPRFENRYTGNSYTWCKRQVLQNNVQRKLRLCLFPSSVRLVPSPSQEATDAGGSSCFLSETRHRHTQRCPATRGPRCLLRPARPRLVRSSLGASCTSSEVCAVFRGPDPVLTAQEAAFRPASSATGTNICKISS